MTIVEHAAVVIAAAQVFRTVLSVVDFVERSATMRRMARVQEESARALQGAHVAMKETMQEASGILHRFRQ